MTRTSARKVTAPMLVLWGGKSHSVPVFGNVLNVWRDYAAQVEGEPIQSGHYMPEHVPDQIFDHFMKFFGTAAQ